MDAGSLAVRPRPTGPPLVAPVAPVPRPLARPPRRWLAVAAVMAVAMVGAVVAPGVGAGRATPGAPGAPGAAASARADAAQDRVQHLLGGGDRAAAASGDATPLWDVTAVTVVTSGRAVVVGAAPRRQLVALAAAVDTAARAVDATWGTAWPRRTLVEVPATAAQLTQVLGTSDPDPATGTATPAASGSVRVADGAGQLAAVTVGRPSASGATTGDHVVISPVAFAELSPAGQRVVLTHELTHVATRHGAAGGVPDWLAEGFADHVAYAAAAPWLTREQVAGDELAQVRAGRLPIELPDDAAFDPARGDVGPAYSQAWLAVQVLAGRCGTTGLVRLYRQVAASSAPTSDRALEAALSRTCGLDQAQLVTVWREALVAWSRS